jgi:hypothetical protein
MQQELEDKIKEVLDLKFRPPFDHPLRQSMWDERKSLYDTLCKEQTKLFRKNKSVSKNQRDEMKIKRLDAWIALYKRQKLMLSS